MSGRVVIVGSLSLDFVMRVPRRPAKGETIAGFDFNTFVGGKGNNQALAAARAGAEVSLVGRVGDDSYGDRLIEMLRDNNVGVQHLRRDPLEGTGIANIYVDPEGDNSIVIVPRANAKLSMSDIEAAKEVIAQANVLLLQMEIPDEIVLLAAMVAKRAGVKVILNPAPAPPSGKLPDELLSYVDILIPNQPEAQLLSGCEANDVAGAKQAAFKLQQAGANQVIVTLGEQGALLHDADGKDTLIPSFSVKAIDTTAAGDAFCGALAAAIARGDSMQEAIRTGCAAGALAVTKCGAEPSLPTRSQISELMAAVT